MGGPDPEELVRRLRLWARLSAAPLEVPPARPPNEAEVAARLREAAALWVAAAKLGELGRRSP